MLFLRKVKGPLLLSYWSKEAHLNGQDFCQKPKNLFFGPFLGLFEPSLPDLLIFILYDAKYHKKNRKKTDDPEMLHL